MNDALPWSRTIPACPTPERDKKGRFAPGSSGNPRGRHESSHLRLNDAFFAALAEHWERFGKEAIERFYQDRPFDYVRMVALLMPRHHQHHSSEVRMVGKVVREVVDMAREGFHASDPANDGALGDGEQQA